MTIAINPRKVFRTLVYVITVLALINLGLTLLRIYTGHGRLWGLGTLFNEGLESNIPTWFSAFSLLAASCILYVIAADKRHTNAPYAGHWKWLSILLLYLSIDEGCMVHERIGEISLKLFRGTTFGAMGWVGPFGIIGIIVAVVYIGFMMHLPSVTRRLLFLAGSLYVGSGLVMELIGGLLSVALGKDNAITQLLSTIEEPSEMLAVAILIYALLSYQAANSAEVHLRLAEDSSTEPGQASPSTPASAQIHSQSR